MPTARRRHTRLAAMTMIYAALTSASVASAEVASTPAEAATPARLALMPVKFLDTSNEARDQTADHAARQSYFTQAVVKAAPQVTPLDPAGIAAVCAIETPRCLADFARGQGADTAVFVVVHKSSTLIMQAFVQRLDLRAETVTGKWDISFRGDTDESWRRAGRYLGGLLAR